MIAEPNLPANHHVVFNCHTAADAGLCSNHYALANVAVVSHVDQVVNLRPAANPRLSQRRAIDAGVRAKLNIIFNDDGAPLRKLVVAHVVTDVAEAVGADHQRRHAERHDRQSSRRRKVSRQDATHSRDRPARDRRSLRLLRCASRLRRVSLAYRDVWADKNCQIDVRSFRNRCRLMHKRFATFWWMQQFGNLGEGKFGFRHFDQRRPKLFFND